LIRLDSDRAAYCDWAADLVRVIHFGTLVVDNATSLPHEIRDFKNQLLEKFRMAVTVLPIGKGQMIVQARE
jgi:predicted O-methyltransferase YrrM